MPNNGILSRRDFVKTGATFLTAVSAGPAIAVNIESLPESMLVPGVKDEPYGEPSSYEVGNQRGLFDFGPLSLLSAAYAPIQAQKGVITPSGLHFTTHHSGIPNIEPENHKLYIHGLTEKALSFSVSDLMRYPMRGGIHFLECAGNSWWQGYSPKQAQDKTCQELYGLMSGSEWYGVPVKLLLNEAGLKPSGKWVIAEGADTHSMTRSIPLQKLLDDAIIALYQNGERLRPAQGYPMRLFLPGWEGNTNVKWLRRLEVVDQPAYTKDESKSYTETLADGSIEQFSLVMGVKSVITHPSAGQKLPDKGFYEISGLAWSGSGTISSVEVSDDNGKTWHQAELSGPVLRKSLTRFSIPWKWAGNTARLLSRATDELGNEQPSHQAWTKHYMAGSYNHYNAIQTWHIDQSGAIRNVF